MATLMLRGAWHESPVWLKVRIAQHDPGNEVGIFETPHGRIAVMICFDVENADIFEETLSHDPVVILNPTWIPLPRVISTMPSVASPSCSYPLSLLTAWGNAMETMSHKFENICIERGIYLVRTFVLIRLRVRC